MPTRKNKSYGINATHTYYIITSAEQKNNKILNRLKNVLFLRLLFFIIFFYYILYTHIEEIHIVLK